MKISIVVPLYQGKRYLDSILEQIQECVEHIRSADVELILYNDYPNDNIQVDNIKEYSYEIKVINPGVNRGIHGARVWGLEESTGEFILFLDQDDKILPTYLISQINCIGKADAVVCRLINNQKLHYTNTHIFEEVVTKEFMLKKWCPIVSPGQVLIRRSSIPQLWKDNIMVNNGADDYFLWLLMVAQNKTFSLNQEILFEHVETGVNTSGDTNKMMDSELEMIQLLQKSHVFHGEDEMLLSRLSLSLRRVHIKILDNYKRTFYFMQQWNRILANGNSPYSFFNNHKIKRLAIYGAGDLGVNIETLLKMSDIKVVYFIDQNAEYIISDKPVYKLENMPDDSIDAIILTIKNSELKKRLENSSSCKVYDAEEILLG